jgi:hypothetical protein
MDDLTKILLTSSATVIGGVAIFVAGQVIGKFVIEPIHDFKKVLGEIRFSLVFYAQAILTPVGNIEAENEASKVLRRLSCELASKRAAIPFYGLWAAVSFGFLPRQRLVSSASEQLMGLSNSLHQKDRSDKNGKRISKIESALGFDAMAER